MGCMIYKVRSETANLWLVKCVRFTISIGYITRGRSLRDLHTRPRAAGPRECKSRRDRLTSDVTNLYHGKSIEHLTIDLKIGTASGPS